MELLPFWKKKIKFDRPPTVTGISFKKLFLETSVNIAALEFPITGLENFSIRLMISLPLEDLLRF